MLLVDFILSSYARKVKANHPNSLNNHLINLDVQLIGYDIVHKN